MKALLVAVLPVLSALALALPGAVPAAGRDHSAAVTRWISVDLAEIAAHRTNPPRAARGLALLSVAIDDASRVPRKHRRAAIAGAATTVLTYLYPDRAGALEALAADERPQVALEWGRGPVLDTSRTQEPTALTKSGREACRSGLGSGCRRRPLSRRRSSPSRGRGGLGTSRRARASGPVHLRHSAASGTRGRFARSTTSHRPSPLSRSESRTSGPTARGPSHRPGTGTRSLST
jgi:hypothetical protein